MKARMNRMILILCLIGGSVFSTYAQKATGKITVKGKVTDVNNTEPIIGASVTIKGTNDGTVTDLDGNFIFNVSIGETLVISYIGYKTQEVIIKDQTFIWISLEENIEMLEEMIVVGYSVQPKVNLSGAVGVVSSRSSRGSRKTQKESASYSYSAPSSAIYGSRAPQYDYNNTHSEEYGSYSENRFISASKEALSTFSLDVDAASYSNMRRIINQGRLPEKDAVRIEELVNYFSYDYKQPTGEHPVNIVTETAVCPWNEQHKLVRIGVKAKEIASDNLPASNFVFLIDVSGSMYGATRLDLVKSSLKLLVNNLRDKDRVAIVVYAGAAGEILPSTAGSDKQKILEAIDKLTAGGSTAGGAGIQLAYKIAEKNFVKDGNNRIVLCTDGDFNVGVSSNSDLEKLIESKRQTGIFLTVLGYGMGNYKDSKLQTLAQKGNGNHAYIDNIQEANKVLVNEFGGTMHTVAKDVKIQVEFNPAYVNAYRLVGYESRMLEKEDFNDDTKDAGELGAGHTVTALYEIIPVGVENTFGSVDDLKYQKKNKKEVAAVETTNEYSNELLTVKLRYKQPDENKSKKMEIPVLMSEIEKKPSDDFKFAMAVAMFGQVLKASDFKGDGTYEKVIKLANDGIGKDQHGYRKEFVRLAESVNQLAK